MWRPALFLTLALSACSSAPSPVTAPPEALPAMRTFAPARPEAPQRPNANMVQDFLELVFQMEDGRSLPVMSRFEGPVRLAVLGPAPEVTLDDLGHLLARLRREARIDIAQTAEPAHAQIVVEFIPRASVQALAPETACFVVPRVANFAEFRRQRRTAMVDWIDLRERKRIAIFIPHDTTPQEMRDCLHEEIAQALGPLNDLYRLSDSIFNDDNFHSVLTGFDMLLLRAYYAPELASGMTREEVARRLPALLRRLNPQGERATAPDPGPTPAAWVNAVEVALSPEHFRSDRTKAARYAVHVADERGWQDARLGISLYALGRAVAPQRFELALAAFLRAGITYGGLPMGDIHLAHLDMQMAAFALSAGQADHALLLAERATGPARRAENAALLGSALMLRAAALEALGRDEEAQSVRLDSLGWAQYGFGSDEEVRRRMAEIASLAPAAREAGG